MSSSDIRYDPKSRSDNNTLPPSLRNVLENTNAPDYCKFPYDVALAMEAGVYAMCWKIKNDEDFYEADHLGQHYSKLGSFIAAKSANTVFGPYHSYFSTTAEGLSWQNLPPELETIMMNRIKLGRPKSVALGVRGAIQNFVAQNNPPSALSYNLLGQYSALQPLMDSADERARRNSTTFVALSPYNAEHYFVAFGNGTAQWNLPQQMHADVNDVAGSLRPLPAAAPGQPNTLLGAALNFQIAAQTNMALNNVFRAGW
ncbi:hypothetical protein DFH06DRAFT_1489318 [Mycena polygramma]|nr:hypothetical protein DFH06DRAFT_1489318 [Mycena polygramma]